MVCGEGLHYLDKSTPVLCIYCGTHELGHISCPNGHYICDLCHNRDALLAIQDFIRKSPLTDALAIAEAVMCFPGLPMLGCQHAYIAGGALMAALKNEGQARVTDNDIQEVFNRTEKQAHGGYCGLTGVCGIAPAIGACFAVLTGSKCGTDREQRITMQAVSQVTRAIIELTGPSCCKAYVRTALGTATVAIRETFNISLTTASTPVCHHSDRHPHGCRREQCPYYDGGLSATKG